MSAPPDILRRICADTAAEVVRRKASRADLRDRLAEAPAPRGFALALDRTVATGGFGVIAEIKRLRRPVAISGRTLIPRRWRRRISAGARRACRS